MMNIPLLDLKAQYSTIKAEIKEALEKVCDSQRFILGEEVASLELKVAEYSQSAYATGVASGSDALLLSMMAEKIGYGDEVITTPYTFFATAGSITRLGAKPVFVDIEPETYNINPELLEEKITKKTKAVIPVHLYGQCAEMDSIMEIADRHNLVVIEDAAQAIGAEYKTRRAGSLGHYGCFSFFPSKNLGGFGDGGMVTTNNEESANRLKVLRVHGSKPKYYHSVVGCNSRLDTLQAAILLVKLNYLEKWTETRRNNAQRYDKMLSNSKLNNVITTPHVQPHNRHIYNQYTIRLEKRDELIAHFRKNAIGTEIYYPLPLHIQECFRELNYHEGDFPVSEKAAKETMSLPVYPEMTQEMQTHVISIMEKFFT